MPRVFSDIEKHGYLEYRKLDVDLRLSINESYGMDTFDKNATPAARIIAKLGLPKVMEITGRKSSVVYRWTYSKDNGGTGGIIPADSQQLLMAAARRGEIDITADDFFPLETEGG